MLPSVRARIIKCKCSVAIVLSMLVVVRALATPATTLAVVSTYVNDVKTISSFNFHMIPGIISCDGTLALLAVVSLVISSCYVTM